MTITQTITGAKVAGMASLSDREDTTVSDRHSQAVAVRGGYESLPGYGLGSMTAD